MAQLHEGIERAIKPVIKNLLTREDIGAARQIVLYPGTERYKLDQKTEVMSLDVLLHKELHRTK